MLFYQYFTVGKWAKSKLLNKQLMLQEENIWEFKISFSLCKGFFPKLCMYSISMKNGIYSRDPSHRRT